MFNLSFLSSNTPIPDITVNQVANANIGAVFVGNTNDVYVRINKTFPTILGDWLKVYPTENTSYFKINDDIITILDTILFTGNNGATTILDDITKTILISGNILSGSDTPSITPDPDDKTYFYIKTSTNELYLWNLSAWVLLSFGSVSITDNLDGTYTMDGLTFDGTDDQDTTEVTISPTIEGETNLETLLTDLTNETYNVSAPFAQFEIFDKKGLGLTCKSYSQGVGALTYSWSTTGSSVISDDTLVNTDILFSTPGNYVITLTVTDASGTIGTSEKEVNVENIIYVGGLQASYYALQDAVDWINNNISIGDIPSWSIYVEGITTDSSPVTINKAKIHIRFYGKISTGLVINASGDYYIEGSTVFYPAINAGNNVGINISGNSVNLYLSSIRIESTISFTPIINITGTSCTINGTGVYIKGPYGILTNSTTTLTLYESFIEATKCAANLVDSTIQIHNLVVDSFANLDNTDHINHSLVMINGCKGTIKGLVVNGVADGSTAYYAITIIPSASYTTKLYFLDGYVKLTGFSTITNGTNIVSALFCKDISAPTQSIIVRDFGCNCTAVALTLVSNAISTANSFLITRAYLLGAASLLVNNSGDTISQGTGNFSLYKNTLNGSVLST
jgi:hypothetical protein